MKIDFGETVSERMERLQKWHTVFAWLPKQIDTHDYRWLEYVQRRAVILSYLQLVQWEYKTL